jgi:hypothetical protein
VSRTATCVEAERHWASHGFKVARWLRQIRQRGLQGHSFLGQVKEATNEVPLEPEVSLWVPDAAQGDRFKERGHDPKTVHFCEGFLAGRFQLNKLSNATDLKTGVTHLATARPQYEIYTNVDKRVVASKM